MYSVLAMVGMRATVSACGDYENKQPAKIYYRVSLPPAKAGGKMEERNWVTEINAVV